MGRCGGGDWWAGCGGVMWAGVVGRGRGMVMIGGGRCLGGGWVGDGVEWFRRLSVELPPFFLG